MDAEAGQDPASESDDDDEAFNFDTVAQHAVDAIQGASSSSSREVKQLGLDVGLGADQLYLASPGRAAFDTSAAPGVSALEAHAFVSGAGPSAPAAAAGSREVRGMPVRPVNDKNLQKKETASRREDKLDKWFGLPKRKLTPELEKELKALQLRGSYDPKRFYKSNDSKSLPTHFVMATEIGGGLAAAGLAANHEPRWNSGRSFLDTVLRDSKAQEWAWKKHGEVTSRGHAAFNSGHGKPGANGGRKGLKGTKRGGTWKKKRKG